MALVSKSIPNLINGVSQQPAALRLESQGEVQENGLSDVVDGLKKRPPTKFLKKLVRCSSTWQVSTTASPLLGNLSTGNVQTLSTAELADAYIHTYKRSGDEQYTVVILPDATTPIVLVYDILGNLRYESKKSSWLADGTTITYVKSAVTYYGNSDDTSYLVGVGSTALSNNDITSTSVADATFILNKNKIVGMASQKIPDVSGYSALVYLKTVNYGRDYNITINTKTKDSTLLPLVGSAVTLNSNQEDNGNYNNNRVFNDNLKVSSVLTALRGSLITSAGSTTFTNSGQQSQGSTSTGFDTSYSYPLQITEDGDYFETDVEALMTIQLTTTVYSSIPSTLLVTVGGTLINYDANGVQGWRYHDDHASSDPQFNRRIQLPPSVATYVLDNSYGYDEDDYATVRLPYVSIKQTTATGGAGGTNSVSLTVEPFVYTDEPYFVIQSPENGTLKDFTIIATDDDGGTNLRVFKENAKSFTDLPNQCIDGFRLGVIGDNQKKEDNFHVVFTGEAGSGYWKESVKAGLFNYFDLTTMPHLLKQDPEQLGSLRFEFAQGSWDERKAGDDDTNTRPSFVGQALTDVFFHRNRLGVLAGENVVFSEASGYFNFWRTTVRALLDSDPIDVAVSQNEVSVLKAAVPIQDNLLLFSELNQFTLSAAQLLTPTEVTIDQSTKFECDLEATPVGAGNSVFFATKAGGFAGIREYYTNNDTEIKDANLITSHIPQYLAGNVRKMAASSNENILICLTNSDKKEAYIYNWYDQGNERLQSAWSKWKFDKEIEEVSFNNATLYFIFNDGSFEYLSLAPAAVEVTTTFGGSSGGTINAFTPIYWSTGSNDSHTGFSLNDGSWPHTFGLGVVNIQRTAQTIMFQFENRFTAHSNITSISIGSSVFDLTDAATNTTGHMGLSYTQYYLELPPATFDSIAAEAADVSIGGGVNYVPMSYQIGGSAQTTISFKKAGLEACLDHQVRLEASTFGGVVTTLNGLYEPTALTSFVDFTGKIIGQGNSAATLSKVVAAISEKTHLEDGVTVNSYVYAGEPYQFKYQFSEQVYKPDTGDYTDLSRLQLRSMSLNYNDTGTFKVNVKSRGRETRTTDFTGRILGQKDNILDYSPIVERGSIKVGVQSQAKETNITITNDSHLPCIFQSAEWEGFITLRNKRL